MMSVPCCKNAQCKKKLRKKEELLEALRSQGLRITKQRKLIVEIILNHECACCKEIFWEAQQKDPSIGIATVYRMVKTLEEIGAIDRRNLYRIDIEKEMEENSSCKVVLKDQKVVELSQEEFLKALHLGLERTRGLNAEEIESVFMPSGYVLQSGAVEENPIKTGVKAAC